MIGNPFNFSEFFIFLNLELLSEQTVETLWEQ